MIPAADDFAAIAQRMREIAKGREACVGCGGAGWRLFTGMGATVYVPCLVCGNPRQREKPE